MFFIEHYLFNLHVEIPKRKWILLVPREVEELDGINWWGEEVIKTDVDRQVAGNQAGKYWAESEWNQGTVCEISETKLEN